MTVQIQCCIFIPSCFIWLALSNQIASAKKIIYLIEEKNENFQIDTNGKGKHDLGLENAFREDLRAKFKHYRHYNNQPKPKTQLIKQFDRKHQILDDKQMINSSMNNLNLPPLNQNNSKSTQPNYISSNNLIKKIKRQKLEESLIKRISPNRKKPFKASDLNSNSDSKYILPPTVAAPEKIHPFTTTLPLNNVPISHLTDWEFYAGSTFGDDNNTSISAGGIVKLSGKVTESISKDNVYTVDQKGSYLQLQRIRKNRKIELTRNEPHTMFGMQMQMSFVASCLTGEDIEGKKCSYTPGLITDRNSIDPDLFVPTRIVQSSNMNEVVTPESLAVMRLPGFQTGTNGQEIGLDLYFPNAGAFPGNTQGTQVFYERKEEINNTQIGLYSQVRQIVKANDNKAVIGRTIRGFGLVTDSDNLLLNSAVQLGNIVLPDINPRLQGGTEKVNTNINKNLFIAANTVRIPTSSYTFYQAGIGSAESLKPGIKKRSQIPRAKFNSLWIGISPIIERRIEKITRYRMALRKAERLMV